MPLKNKALNRYWFTFWCPGYLQVDNKERIDITVLIIIYCLYPCQVLKKQALLIESINKLLQRHAVKSFKILNYILCVLPVSRSNHYWCN